MIGEPLVGKGTLIVGNSECADVGYRIEVQQDHRGLLRGLGALTTPRGQAHILVQAFGDAEVALVISSGHRLPIVPSRSSIDKGAMTFTFSGPVPGLG